MPIRMRVGRSNALDALALSSFAISFTTREGTTVPLTIDEVDASLRISATIDLAWFFITEPNIVLLCISDQQT